MTHTQEKLKAHGMCIYEADTGAPLFSPSIYACSPHTDADDRLHFEGLATDIALRYNTHPALLAACESVEKLLAFHEGSAETMRQGGEMVVWINEADMMAELASLRAAIAATKQESPHDR